MTHNVPTVEQTLLRRNAIRVSDMHLIENTMGAILLWFADNIHHRANKEQVYAFRETYKDQPQGECIFCITDFQAGMVEVCFIQHHSPYVGDTDISIHWLPMDYQFSKNAEFLFL